MLQTLLPHRKATLYLFKQISKFPLGNHIFAKGITFRAPYCSTIHPLVKDLNSGLCGAGEPRPCALTDTDVKHLGSSGSYCPAHV